MNEAETRAELIDPALKAAGWGVVDGSRVRREMIAPGRLLGGGRRAAANYADYVLEYKGEKLGVIEAKQRGSNDTEGVGQAKDYADKLEIRFAYSTNGDGLYQIDMTTGEEGYITAYPSPDELWHSTFTTENEWRDRFAAIPFEDRSGTWDARYYQHIAIGHVLKAISEGRDRILLTMATGTGKTFVAFQLTWKLFQSRWNLGYRPTRRPRILFLADRNILANQAFNAFSAFPEDALIRIDPDAITKKGRVPKNGSVFFTIFQTFMAGKDDDGNPAPNFGDYPSDFFDFIIVDECHRGGARDESNWRSILEYFSPAVQLGLTATPKRENNADTYDYFGEPVYSYALKQGINDGYLTPFKVRQVETSLDEYQYSLDDDLIEGDLDQEKTYTEADFNRIIEIEAREKKRVQIFMEAIDQRQKTLVFCATQDHALAVRNLINQMKVSSDPNYCVRVTADDGKRGEHQLKTFQDNEKTIPTILTTSQKLSTGVDARNIRNIVLMRPINSMIEFKQIIGRGTRLFDGKDYFTIYDFVKAYEHFNDREWDGEPLAPEPVTPRDDQPVSDDTPGEKALPDSERLRPQRIKIELADGKERAISHQIQTSFWSPEGKPMSAAEFIERLFGDIPTLFQDEAELRTLWSLPDTRKKLLAGLAEKGYAEAQLTEISCLIDAGDSDIYDVLAFIAYADTPISRQERVTARRALILSHYADSKQQAFLDFVLEQYVKEGVGELDISKLPQLLELKYRAIKDAVRVLGNVNTINQTFVNFQQYLYSEDMAS
ncbi:MAG: restriction endonuclease subunit R [Leptolyngbya foveolarum]|uniref:Restriction endonuclease subunit R n=1 Tax=Leptolyngbya foveolarum TaxID=47253 RepID=A0A2W4WM76_9CYAN|nr:MAG: restriction endonuclease subunit R [Leptolyngbya foveolarum]